MTDIAALTRLIEPEATALGFGLVRVKMTGGKGDPTLQIMAERPDTRQLTIDDCAALSRRVSDMLDEKDPIEHEYRLEVSSPGIDRPLTRFLDFDDWQGHDALITLHEPRDAQKRFKGVLTGTDHGVTIMLTTPDGMINFFAMGEIASAKLVLTDRLIAATAPLSIEGADELEDEPVPENDGAAQAEELN